VKNTAGKINQALQPPPFDFQTVAHYKSHAVQSTALRLAAMPQIANHGGKGRRDRFTLG
jgi:hypothetical protein